MTVRQRLRVSVDDRTDKLSDEALVCRTFGHDWQLRAISRRRFTELIARGHSEYHRVCHCGSTWRQLWDVRTGEVLENERKYPSGGEYLLPPNSGRLRRTEARVAQFARQHPSYA